MTSWLLQLVGIAVTRQHQYFFSGKQVAVIIPTLVCLRMIKKWLRLLPTCIFTLLQSFTNVLLEVNWVTIRSCLSWVSTFNKRKFVYSATCTTRQSPVFYKDLHSMIPGEAADSGPRLTFRTDTKNRTSRAERSSADLSASNRAPPESYMKAGSGYNCLVGWRSWDTRGYVSMPLCVNVDESQKANVCICHWYEAESKSEIAISFPVWNH